MGDEEMKKSGHIQEKRSVFMKKIQPNYCMNCGDMKKGLLCSICD